MKESSSHSDGFLDKFIWNLVIVQPTNKTKQMTTEQKTTNKPIYQLQNQLSQQKKKSHKSTNHKTDQPTIKPINQLTIGHCLVHIMSLLIQSPHILLMVSGVRCYHGVSLSGCRPLSLPGGESSFNYSCCGVAPRFMCVIRAFVCVCVVGVPNVVGTSDSMVTSLRLASFTRG